MKRILLSFSLALWSGMAAWAGDATSYKECSQVLREAEKAGARITKKHVEALVAAANSRCLSYAETSEWINEAVFSALQLRPNDFLESFSNANSAVKKNVIRILENPVHDGIDLGKAYSSIQSVTGEGSDKQTVLSALRTAGEKMGLQFK